MPEPTTHWAPQADGAGSASAAPLATEVITDPARLEELRGAWDELAVAARRPYSSPAWLLSWWRHARPVEARLATVVSSDGESVVGIAPFWYAGRGPGGAIYSLLGGRLATPTGPLAAPGREAEVAAATARALANTDPRPVAIRMDRQASEPDWPGLLAGAWPGRPPWTYAATPVRAPALVLGGQDWDAWLAAQSKNFRGEARRMRRRLEEAGARFVLVEPQDAERALRAFVELHGARWSNRGGSNALVRGLEPMLADVARELMPSGRFRFYTIQAEGRIVSVQVMVAAGGELSYWNGGFDEAWAEYSPAFQTLVFAVRDALERRDERLDLGPGVQQYKRRLANDEAWLRDVLLVPHGASYPLARARFAPHQARWGISRRLSRRTKRRLRRLMRR